MPPDRRGVRYLHGHCIRSPCTPQGLRRLRMRAESTEPTPCPRGQVSRPRVPERTHGSILRRPCASRFPGGSTGNPRLLRLTAPRGGPVLRTVRRGIHILETSLRFRGNRDREGIPWEKTSNIGEPIFTWYRRSGEPLHGTGRTRDTAQLAPRPRAYCPHSPRALGHDAVDGLILVSTGCRMSLPMVARCPMSRTVDRTRRATIVSSHRHGTR